MKRNTTKRKPIPRKRRKPSQATLRAFEYSALIMEWCMIATLLGFALAGLWTAAGK